MYKDILVPQVLGEMDEAALAHACALAAAHDAHVAALVAVSLSMPSANAWMYYPAGTYETMDQAARATNEALARTVEARLAREPARHEVRTSDAFWLTPGEVSSQHARYADLVVMGVGRPLQDVQRRLFADLLADAGRPVLMVPQGAPTVALERIAVAWKSSREAARAIHDALPLLRQARTVDVLVVERPGGQPSGHRAGGADADDRGTDDGSMDDGGMDDGGMDDGGMDIDRLLNHLRRQSVQAGCVRRPRAHSSTAQAIIDQARDSGAGLVVAGGYSHARALEQVFGGVTRELLEASPVPVLFSH